MGGFDYKVSQDSCHCNTSLSWKIEIHYKVQVKSFQTEGMCYNKNYQQMRLFVTCLYFLFLVFSPHVSGFHEPIIRGITSCCFYATIWFMQCFVDRLRASADWFVVVTSVY